MSQQQMLSTLQQLVTDGRPTFGVFERVEHINHLDYHSYLLSNKPISMWRKRLRANQFCFVHITQAPYHICFAIATLNWVTSCFCYFYNEETDEFQVVEALQPLTRNATFNQSTYHGDITFKSRDVSIALQFSKDQLDIEVDAKFNNKVATFNTHLVATLQRPAPALSVCTPTGKTGWTYTHKEPMSAISGMLKTPTQDIDLAQATASLDWSLGYMRRVTNWFWTSISDYLSDGRPFALNLATGVNESGASENACWIDGVRYHLPAVLFSRGKTPNAPWTIEHQRLNWSNVDIQLTFTPIRCYQKNDRFVVVDSIFEQWIGRYSGYLSVGDTRVELENIIGLAEDHYAKW